MSALARGVRAAIETARKAHHESESTYTLRVLDHDKSLLKLLQNLQYNGNVGHSVSFQIDGESFGFDGDGGDKILEIKVDGTVEKAR